MENFDQVLSEVKRIGKEIAATHASDVDINGRFPIETISALKESKILSVSVPESLGGLGLNIIEQGDLCRILARHCASSAMILGMHFIKMSSLVHFGMGRPEFEDYLRKVVQEQRLVGSVTSEDGIGGNLRNSICAVESMSDHFELEKHSTCLSYGAQADDLLVTSRQSADSPASGQVIVLAQKGDFTLEQTGVWDSMGMRGTCSPPFIVKVKAPRWQIFDSPFADVAARTMVPDTHYIWANVWLGIASDAAYKTRKLIQKKARKDPSHLPDGAKELALLEVKLQQFKDTVTTTGKEYLEAHLADDTDLLSSMAFSLKINALKLSASTLAPEICLKAMAICGFAGYLNNTPFSIARNLRDSLSAAPMIGNGRIIETNATNLLAYKAD
jgi:acyl-CoA dehydrogenase